MITFQLEDWETYYRDCQSLWREHYEEVAVDKGNMVFGPDVSFYQFLGKNGGLQILTARSAGRMVGYCLVMVKPHPHYRAVLCGFEDSYFLSKPERKGMTGVRLIQRSVTALRARGVKKVFFMSKEAKPLEAIFRRLGFSPSDRVWAMWIGEN